MAIFFLFSPVYVFMCFWKKKAGIPKEAAVFYTFIGSWVQMRVSF